MHSSWRAAPALPPRTQPLQEQQVRSAVARIHSVVSFKLG